MADNSTYLVDDFVTTKAGTPFRMFPFGKVVKGGVEHNVTPELAKRFKTPHFKPPIKLGSHEETTPAGGHLISLSVVGDGNCELCYAGECSEHGLFCMPEWTPKGETSIADGDYRYNSPEVIWPGGALEDPKTGKWIEGPLIVGTALLHMPHLGEDAKLYGIKPTPKKELDTMTEETVNVPKSFYDSIISFFGSKEPAPAEEPAPVIVADTDEFKAVAKERDDLAAEIQEQKDAAEKQELRASIVSNLQDVALFGASYAKQEDADSAAEMLASMSEEQREWTTTKIKALTAQIEESNLTGEEGSSAEGSDNPAAEFNAAVKVIQVDQKVKYAEAVQIATSTKPELFAAYRKAQKGA